MRSALINRDPMRFAVIEDFLLSWAVKRPEEWCTGHAALIIHHKEDVQACCPSLVAALARCQKDEARIGPTRGAVNTPHASTPSQGKHEDLITLLL